MVYQPPLETPSVTLLCETIPPPKFLPIFQGITRISSMAHPLCILLLCSYLNVYMYPPPPLRKHCLV